MTVHQFRTPDGRHFCFGRNQPSYAMQSFANTTVPPLGQYIKTTILPPPMLKVDWAHNSPALNRAGLENIKGNNWLGDCVQVACGNVEDIWRADALNGDSVTTDQTIDFYSATSGYVRGDPNTDQGSDEVTVFNYWLKKGFAPGMPPIDGYVSVDPTNVTQLKCAVWLFGNVIFGAALLQPWVNAMGSMRSGFTWDALGKPDLNAGHGFAGYGYNANGIFVCTWGMFGTITWAAIAKVAAASAGGNVFCALSPDWFKKATATSPSGFTAAQLKADLPALAMAA